MGFQNSLAGGQGALERPAIKSPNYVAGSLGWSIKRDGSAEFNNIVIRGGTTVGGVSLYYSGTPALGNLVFSIASAPGTDAYGNHYTAGITTYAVSLTQDVALRNGALCIGISQFDFANCAQIYQQLTNGGDIQIDTGTGDANHLDNVRAAYTAGKGGQTTGSATAPTFSMIDGALTSDVDSLLSGSVIKTTKNGTPYTWQTPSYAANWSAGSSCSGLGGDGLQFRLMAQNDAWLCGLATAAAGAGTTIFTLPAAYRPASGTPHGQVMRDRGGVLSSVEVAIPTSGAVILGSTVNAGDVYSFNFGIPLRNVA